jgi:serine protease Do
VPTVRSLSALLLTLPLVALPSDAVAQRQRSTSAPGDLRAISRHFESLTARISPSVVQIFAVGYVLPEDETADRSLITSQKSSGSGLLVDSEGYIVTNAHVVQGAHRVQVQMPSARKDGERSILRPRARLLAARVVAIDEETDVAVLKVEEKGLPALPLADSDTVRPGQIVLAFGSPLGLDSSVTMGVVSAVGRQLETDDPMIYIQTDASINPGNSGGPLVDAEGRVIGINTLILTQSGGNEGLGFAAPSNIVRNVFEQVRRYGRMRRGDIGIRAQTITPTLAEGLGLSRDYGVVLGDVFPDGPAGNAGLRIGDIVTALDGRLMENGRQLQVNLYSRAVGDTVTLTIEREGKTIEAAVTVVERDDDPLRFTALVGAEDLVVPQLGIVGLDITNRVRELLSDLRASTGVVVASTARDAPASWDGELEAGDVIHAVNRQEVTSVADLRQKLAAIEPGQSIVLQVERDGSLMYVAGRIE